MGAAAAMVLAGAMPYLRWRMTLPERPVLRRDDDRLGGDWRPPSRPVGTVTARLITLNVLVFLVEIAKGDALLARFALWPLGRYYVPELGTAGGFRPSQLVTYAFLHAGFMHLFLNMFALLIFGRDVEAALGAGRYLALYVAAVLSAAVTQLLVLAAVGGEPFPTIGASGGVFGVLLAFGTLYPRRIVTLLFPPIPMPAWLFVILYGALELVQGVVGTQAGVAHFAHVGGMIGGWIVLRRWRRRAIEVEW